MCAIVLASLVTTLCLIWFTRREPADWKIPRVITNRGTLVDLCNNDKQNEIPDSQHMNFTGYHVPDSPLVEDKFTLVMLTHDRDEILRNVLHWYGNMTKIDRIILYWNNPGRSAPDFYQELNLSIPLITEEVNITNLGERFQPNLNIRTEGKPGFQPVANVEIDKLRW